MVHEVTYKVERLMASEEGIKNYMLRSRTVEAHNGTFKRIYHYDDIPIIGIRKSSELNVHHCSIIQPNTII